MAGTSPAMTIESRPPPPQGAVAPGDQRQPILIARPVGVLRQLELLLRLRPALRLLLAEALHFGRGFVQQSEDVLRILFGAEPPVGLARMAGNHALPIQ